MNHSNTTFQHYRRIIWILSSITLVCLVATAVMAVALLQREPSNAASRQDNKTSKTAGNSSGTDQQNNDSGSKSAEQNSKNTAPANPACQLLTTTIATQALGTPATQTDPGDTSSLATPDTTLASCAYAASAGSAPQTVQLIVRSPKNSLGVSKNAIVFGSERPANAVSVNGYGQSAYWNPDTRQLNVLGSNKWYIISRTSGGSPAGQSDAEAVAKLIQGGF